MSYRDKTAVLTKAALIVWAIAAVVAVTVGLALLFTLAGVEINFGLVIGALSAIGSLSAAAAAVWVALWSAARNRQENEMERHAAYEAQARLVLLEVELHNENPSAPFFVVLVRNCGELSILYVTLESAELASHPRSHYEFNSPRGTAPEPPLDLPYEPPTDTMLKQCIYVVRPDRESDKRRGFEIRFVDDTGESVLEAKLNPEDHSWSQDTADPTKVSATVRFMDAHGIWWRRSTSGLLKRLS